MADPRLTQFWVGAKARLSTATMDGLLYGTGRVFLSTDDYEAVKGPQEEMWGRLVIVPVLPAWNAVYVEGESWKKNFLIRAEFNNYRSEGYEVTDDLENVQEAAYGLLEGWTPLYSKMRTVFNVYRFSIPEGPYMDSPTGMWWSSSEYRFEAAPVAVS